MPYWTPEAGWMRFNHLDAAPQLDACFTIAYRYTDNGNEIWSERANRFKSKDNAAWWGATYLVREAIVPLVRSLGLSPDETIFVPALGSKETQAAPNGWLSVIAKQSSEHAQCAYADGLIAKKTHAQLHSIYNIAGRDEELAKACHVAAKTDASTVMVFDDFVTRGSTLSATAAALKKTNPGIVVYGVALVKAERVGYATNASNEHVGDRWNTLWLQGEEDQKKKAAGK